MLKIRRKEKDPDVRARILLNVLVEGDVVSVTVAARHLGMAPSWGVKWRHRYLKEGWRGCRPARVRAGPRGSPESP